MKRFGLILCTLLLLAVFAGCGDQTPASTTASSGDAEQTSAQTGETLGVKEALSNAAETAGGCFCVPKTVE